MDSGFQFIQFWIFHINLERMINSYLNNFFREFFYMKFIIVPISSQTNIYFK